MSYHINKNRFKNLIEIADDLMNELNKSSNVKAELSNKIAELCAKIHLLDIRARKGEDAANEIEKLFGIVN